MREITDHKLNPVNDLLRCEAIDQPGPGGANHRYRISGLPLGDAFIQFQTGPITEAGINGLTQEVLLAILIDRLRSFQAGPYASRPNELALQHCEEALYWLHARTRERMARGVEGTSQK
jgi:hypothetical protein